MEELIIMIKSDLILKSLVGNNIRPFGYDGILEGVTYTFSPVSEDRVKAVDRLDITAIAFTQGKSLQILDRIKALILTLGDDKLTNKIKKVSLNGGGSLSNVVGDKTMYHNKAYFYVTRRV